MNIQPRDFGSRLTIVILFTLVRPALGAFAALAFFNGSFAIGFTLYVAGHLTDVADGFFARYWGIASRYGAEIDRLADVLLQLMGYAGFVLGALFNWGTIETSWPYLIAIGAPAILLVASSGWLIKPHTKAAKIRSGVYRVLLIGGVLATGDVALVTAVSGCSVLVIIGLYELTVMFNPRPKRSR